MSIRFSIHFYFPFTTSLIGLVSSKVWLLLSVLSQHYTDFLRLPFHPATNTFSHMWSILLQQLSTKPFADLMTFRAEYNINSKFPFQSLFLTLLFQFSWTHFYYLFMCVWMKACVRPTRHHYQKHPIFQDLSKLPSVEWKLHLHIFNVLFFALNTSQHSAGSLQHHPHKPTFWIEMRFSSPALFSWSFLLNLRDGI